ncbi:MAG: type I restriction-modification system subunit M [Bacteroidales bacterium]|nr:type I restriction-modification system subunit M [Bacteroidales bacterium]MDD2204347.1 type I restriction-modification system subunit M [Bacteroidales bacterium]MDD3151849.1 type I restriction-modification system subunit M [Bacteroidales bacterium]MDD3913228.1 type I restriction-modification system subunit M [Bacteroidales bacterium]MDD4633143.1 type I restriction-modification system subunit M [Bacteroidales bacterium]
MENQTTNQSTINRIVWKACDTFRGLIDPSQYKDYILTMLFLKYVSDVYKSRYSEYLEKYEGDEERAMRTMRYERFIIPEDSSFDYLYENRTASNIGELIDIALANIEDANRDKMSSEDGSSIFRNISFNSANLGETKDKNARLKNLLADFKELELDAKHLENNDIIGDAYMFLVSNFASESGKKAGEFFTPSEVSTLLAKLTKSASGSRICDPACGSGSLLIKAGKEVEDGNFSLYGQEVNGSTWALAKMNMFLNRFDNAVIRWGDTLRNPKLKENDKLMHFDTVVANPPFSLDKWGAEEAASDEFNRFWRGIPPKSKGDWAFISHMIEVAQEGVGKVGVVVPHGVLFRDASEGKIRQKTIEENLLEAIIGLPANLFFGTGIPAAIVIFNKGRGVSHTPNNKGECNSPLPVLFIDASREFENGKNQNKLRPQDIEHIVSTYRKFTVGKLQPGVVEDKYAYVATFDEIKENDYNLNIPRYVDTYEEEAEIDIPTVQKEIDTLEQQLAEVQGKMQGYLKELGY